MIGRITEAEVWAICMPNLRSEKDNPNWGLNKSPYHPYKTSVISPWLKFFLIALANTFLVCTKYCTSYVILVFHASEKDFEVESKSMSLKQNLVYKISFLSRPWCSCRTGTARLSRPEWLSVDTTVEILLARQRGCSNDNYRSSVCLWISWKHWTPCDYTSYRQMLQVIVIVTFLRNRNVPYVY